ncbi:MAG: tryptophan synthase subunit alpha [Puniceicoccaceae bacterium]
MNRIGLAFTPPPGSERPRAFVSYLCAGDPDYQTSFRALRILAQEGASILEIGVPFSDPLADGQTNQLAAERALAGGFRSEDVFRLVSELRAAGTEQAIVFYTYYNLVFSRGIDAYVAEAKKAGVDAMLVLDLPPEEGADFFESCQRHEMQTVLIVAPTTPPERLPRICEVATAFIYYVSREGVTGVRQDDATGVEEAVAAIRAETNLPIVVGFGISTPAQVARTCEIADGAVVGSALVNSLSKAHREGDSSLASFRDLVRSLLGKGGS